MDRNKHFEKYYSRLCMEGILKAFVCGAGVGFAANFVAALICWCIPDMTWGLWLSLGVLVLVTAGATAIFYFTLFVPTVERSARRLDSLGLEERLVTMVEYEQDSSYIANLQREDAKINLNKMDVNAIKFVVSTLSIILASVAATLGIGMTTLTTLKDVGIIKPLPGIIDDFIPPEPDVYFSVTYIASGGGYLEGAEEAQVVLKGGNSEKILAVAEDGWAFLCWSDGVKSPSRMEVNVQADIELEALFAPIDENGFPGAPGDEPGDKPSDMPMEGDTSGENGDPNKPSSAGGGRYEDHNQIIDGKTYYGDKYADAFSTMSEMLAGNTEMSSELKEMIKTYFDIIKVESDEDNPWANPEGEE